MNTATDYSATTMKPKASIINLAGLFLAAVVLLPSAAIAESGGNNIAIRPGKTVDGLRLEARARLINTQGGSSW